MISSFFYQSSSIEPALPQHEKSFDETNPLDVHWNLTQRQNKQLLSSEIKHKDHQPFQNKTQVKKVQWFQLVTQVSSWSHKSAVGVTSKLLGSQV